MRNQKTIVALGVLAVAVVGLPVAWYLGSPLFFTRTVNEPPPGALATNLMTATGDAMITPTMDSQLAATEEALMASTDEAMSAATADAQMAATEAMMALEATAAMETAMAEPTVMMEEPMPTQAPAAPAVLAQGSFYHVVHEGEGTATIFELPDGARVLRLDEFTLLNGPDLHVYLVPIDPVPYALGVEIEGSVDLGTLKGNVGSQNYDSFISPISLISQPFRARWYNPPTMQTSARFPTVPNRRPSEPPVPLTVWLARLLIASGFMTVVLAAVVLMLLAAYGLSYRGVVYPGVSAWGQDLAGMTPSETAAALSAAFNYPSTPAFIMRDNGGPAPRTWSATPAQLGVTLDLPASVNAAYEVGRTGNVLVDAAQVFRSWYGGVQVSPVVKYDDQQALVFLNNVAAEVFLPVAEATLGANGTTVTTTPGQIGRQLDVPATAAQLRDPLLRLGAADVPLILIETPPLVLDASAQAAQALAILREPLTLFVENPVEGDPAPLVIDQNALGAMLQVRRVEDGPNAAHYEVGLDPVALRVHLDPLAGPLTQAPENARFIFNDDTHQLELLQPSRSTRQLNIDATIARIKEALAQDAHSVPLVLDVIAPAVPDTATAAELGITQLVSDQSTYFAGSSAERISNIQVAAARFHGLLVAPGATFSFNEHLGDVSLDTGFAEALIIFGGRTIRGVGGGVCQVSTTIFRAAYFGGYPIEERYSHAYRVSYYEKGDAWKGPGLDATVYSPLVDFKFKNDTSSWLLMEVYVTPSAGRITWKFYSTSDGRQVAVSPADVQNVVPAPEPLYEADPTLAAGVIKQTDYAADGADVAVYRTITRDGVQVNAGEPPLTTHYQPWRAVFSYGPGTVIPTPTP